jgi:hypothetical protein
VLCTVCTVHVETRSAGFLVEPQNQGRRFISGLASKLLGWLSTVCQWFCLKTTGAVFSDLASKLVATVSLLSLKTKVVKGFCFGPQNQQLWFGDLGIKIIATVSWFGPQNQAGFGLSVAPQNRQREVGAGHVSRSSSLLHVEASLARVSKSGLKTGRGTTAGGAHGTITKVVSESSRRWTGRCDGLRQTLVSLLYRFLSIRR